MLTFYIERLHVYLRGSPACWCNALKVIVEPTPTHVADYGHTWTRETSQLPFPELSIGGLQYQRNLGGGRGDGGGMTRTMNVNDDDDDSGDDGVGGDGSDNGADPGDAAPDAAPAPAVTVTAPAVIVTPTASFVISPAATPTRTTFGQLSADEPVNILSPGATPTRTTFPTLTIAATATGTPTLDTAATVGEDGVTAAAASGSSDEALKEK